LPANLWNIISILGNLCVESFIFKLTILGSTQTRQSLIFPEIARFGIFHFFKSQLNGLFY
jgi:hypothetical protein